MTEENVTKAVAENLEKQANELIKSIVKSLEEIYEYFSYDNIVSLDESRSLNVFENIDSVRQRLSFSAAIDRNNDSTLQNQRFS